MGRDLRYTDPFGPHFDGPGYTPARGSRRDEEPQPEVRGDWLMRWKSWRNEPDDSDEDDRDRATAEREEALDIDAEIARDRYERDGTEPHRRRDGKLEGIDP